MVVGLEGVAKQRPHGVNRHRTGVRIRGRRHEVSRSVDVFRAKTQRSQ